VASVLRPPSPTGYVLPAEADGRIDVRRIIDLLQHPAGTRESQLSYLALFPLVENKLLDLMSFSLGSPSFILSPSPP
jgi:hypothetical protein